MLFSIERNSFNHPGYTPLGEILIVATPGNFAWVGWMKQTLLESPNPALSQAVICAPSTPDACHIAEQELIAAAERSRHMVFISSPAFYQDAVLVKALRCIWSIDPTSRTRRIIPVRIDGFQASAIMGNIEPIDLSGLSGQEAKDRFVEQLVGLPRRPSKPVPFPGRA